MFSHGFSQMMQAQSHALFVFSGTLFVYLGHRFYKLLNHQIKKESNRILWMKKNKPLVISLLLFSGILTLILGVNYCINHPKITLWGIIALLITIFYVVKIRNKNLREIPYMKNLWVVLVYWFVVVGLTGFSLPVESQPPFYLYLNQLIYIFAIALLFDIPDIHIDPKDQKTIPQVIGIRASYFLSVAASLVFLFYLGLNHGVHWQFISFAMILGLFYFFFRKTKNMELYLSIYGEGILGLLGVYYFVI
jgi:hypothetical protein